MRHVTPFPGPRSVVILDNAVIHKQRRFVRSVSQAGGIVLYLPPYCWDLTPLDNGAFGMVKRDLQKTAWITQLLDYDLEGALDKAFYKAQGRRKGEYCFKNCGYIS